MSVQDTLVTWMNSYHDRASCSFSFRSVCNQKRKWHYCISLSLMDLMSTYSCLDTRISKLRILGAGFSYLISSVQRWNLKIHFIWRHRVWHDLFLDSTICVENVRILFQMPFSFSSFHFSVMLIWCDALLCTHEWDNQEYGTPQWLISFHYHTRSASMKYYLEVHSLTFISRASWIASGSEI